MTEIKSLASRIKIPVENPILSQIFLDLHDHLNSKVFDKNIIIPTGFERFVETVYKRYGFEPSIESKKLSIPSYDLDMNKVLLGFSGGLDSVSQLILLRKKVHVVIPYSMFNVNSYTNGQENKAVETICDKLGLGLVKSNFITCYDKGNPHKKQWQENPIKNQMILATMIDYCLENEIGNISLGDDLNLKLEESVNGTNTTDAVEFTESFLEGLKGNVPEMNFLSIDKGVNKLERIKLMMENGLENDYYSCVAAGRMNRKCHEINERKYGVKLLGNNCGCSCRKCSHHNLLLHYSGLREFPETFLRECWRRLGAKDSADNVLFDKSIPLEDRISNLFSY